ncbi:MAG TPA: MmcQ/YjbR family DNA-binding protein [Blastocatellia bacterium]|nr:MmcQ/YjbR family DNA-binding protein [Blastocatellia bacterium]
MQAVRVVLKVRTVQAGVGKLVTLAKRPKKSHSAGSLTSGVVSPSVASRRRARIIALVESLPGASAIDLGVGHLSLEVRGRRFGYYLYDHHGDGRTAINCKAEPGANKSLADFGPDRFHIPAYLGSRGWIGLWIDLPRVNWDEIESVIVDAYRLTAPKQLLARLRHR